MLQLPENYTADCLRHAAEAEFRAGKVVEKNLKAEYLQIAASWSLLAQRYEFAEAMERFLLDRANDARSEPLPDL